MRTLIRGRGEESWVWYHVVDYQKRDKRGAFSRGYFLHVGHRQCFSVHLSLATSLALIDFEFGEEEDFSFSFAIYKLFFFAFSIARLPIVKRLPGVRYNGKYGSGAREIRLSWRPWTWHWNIWTYPHESKRWWRDGWFDLTDFLLGRAKYSEVRGEEQQITIPMPEGDYPAKLAFVERSWKRPRWPTVKTRMDADIEMGTAIPVPGKGENDWDMDDDALYGINCVASTVEEAIAQVQASAFRDRERYAGEGWIPDDGWPVVEGIASEEVRK